MGLKISTHDRCHRVIFISFPHQVEAFDACAKSLLLTSQSAGAIYYGCCVNLFCYPSRSLTENWKVWTICQLTSVKLDYARVSKRNWRRRFPRRWQKVAIIGYWPRSIGFIHQQWKWRNKISQRLRRAKDAPASCIMISLIGFSLQPIVVNGKPTTLELDLLGDQSRG